MPHFRPPQQDSTSPLRKHNKKGKAWTNNKRGKNFSCDFEGQQANPSSQDSTSQDFVADSTQDWTLHVIESTEALSPSQMIESTRRCEPPSQDAQQDYHSAKPVSQNGNLAPNLRRQGYRHFNRYGDRRYNNQPARSNTSILSEKQRFNNQRGCARRNSYRSGGYDAWNDRPALSTFIETSCYQQQYHQKDARADYYYRSNHAAPSSYRTMVQHPALRYGGAATPSYPQQPRNRQQCLENPSSSVSDSETLGARCKRSARHSPGNCSRGPAAQFHPHHLQSGNPTGGYPGRQGVSGMEYQGEACRQLNSEKVFCEAFSSSMMEPRSASGVPLKLALRFAVVPLSELVTAITTRYYE